MASYVPIRARCLGLCNVTLPVLSAFVHYGCIKPKVVQNRFCRKTNYDVDVRSFCATHGIIYQGFRILTGSTELLDSTSVLSASRLWAKSKEQSLYMLVLALGIVILNGTQDQGHMEDDLACLGTFDDWVGLPGNAEPWAALKSDFMQVLHKQGSS
jgi:diketogulonate reductase-like aldo/keto reductase